MNTITPPTGRATTNAAPSSDWRSYGACRETDPEIFFPEGSKQQIARQTEAAKRVCGNCRVRERCLDWALAAGQTLGVWGGLTGDELRLLNRGVPAQAMAEALANGRTLRESRYWPMYPNAVEGILATRMPQVQRLIALGEPVGVMAMELNTNAQTVKKVLARLEELKAQEVQAA